jgi:hypothetical protein
VAVIAAPVELELLADGIERRLDVETIVDDLVDRQESVGDEAVQPPLVVLPLHEDSAVLQHGIDREISWKSAVCMVIRVVS